MTLHTYFGATEPPVAQWRRLADEIGADAVLREALEHMSTVATSGGCTLSAELQAFRIFRHKVNDQAVLAVALHCLNDILSMASPPPR